MELNSCLCTETDFIRHNLTTIEVINDPRTGKTRNYGRRPIT